MNKNVVWIIIVGIVVAAGIYIGYTAGNQKGYTEGYEKGKQDGRAAAQTEVRQFEARIEIPVVNPLEGVVNPFEGVYQNPFE